MNSLTELYNEAIVPLDAELEKQAAELIKQAEEEDAAGRIMARGFADELNKLAETPKLPVMRQPNFSIGGRAKATEVARASSKQPAFSRDTKVTIGGNIAKKPPAPPKVPSPTGGSMEQKVAPPQGKQY